MVNLAACAAAREEAVTDGREFVVVDVLVCTLMSTTPQRILIAHCRRKEVKRGAGWCGEIGCPAPARGFSWC